MNNSSGSCSKSAGQPGVVVMKFGGSSVEDAHAIRRLVRIVRSRLNFRAVVVVSALAKVTDELLRLGRTAENGEPFEVVLAELQCRHEQVSADLVPAEERTRLYSEVASEFAELRTLLREGGGAGQLSPQQQDQLLGFGERFSIRIVAAALRHQGVDADLVDARDCIVTDSRHTQASPLWSETNHCLSKLLNPLLTQRRVPVLGGFVGATKSGVPTTLGRGRVRLHCNDSGCSAPRMPGRDLDRR